MTDKTYIWLGDVLRSDYGQPNCNVCKGKKLYVEARGSDCGGNYSEADVTALEKSGEAIVLVEGKAGNRIHLRPRGDKRWLMFGGTFAYCSDSRFPYERPVHIHDRWEG